LEDTLASGINWDSILNDLTYFHVCDGYLVPDIMHNIQEGALQYEVKLLLKVMTCAESYITLDEINARLECLELGHMESISNFTQSQRASKMVYFNV